MTNPVYQSATVGEKILVMADFTGVGNAYTSAVSITLTKDVTFTTNWNSAEIYRLDDVSAPAMVRRGAKSLDSTITGQGTLDTNETFKWINYQQTGKALPVQIWLNPTTDDPSLLATFGNATINATVITGTYGIGDFKITAPTHDLATGSVTLNQSGPIEITSQAPNA